MFEKSSTTPPPGGWLERSLDKLARLVKRRHPTEFAMPMQLTHISGDSSGGNFLSGATRSFTNMAAATSGLPPALRPMFGMDVIGDPRWVDPYTMVPTFVNENSYVVHPTIAAPGTSNDGCLAFCMTGSGTKTCYYDITVSTTASAGSSSSSKGGNLGTAGTITWNSGSFLSAGLASAGYMERPIGIVAKFTFTAVATDHDIFVTAVPDYGRELSTYRATANDWPTVCSAGLTRDQKMMGGREITMHSGDTLYLCSTPCDPDSMVFLAANVERNSWAWGTWAVAVYGLNTVDRVTLELTTVTECFAVGGLTTGVVTPETSYTPSDAGYMDTIVNTAQAALSSGLAAFVATEGSPVGDLLRWAIGGRGNAAMLQARTGLGRGQPPMPNFGMSRLVRPTFSRRAPMSPRETEETKEDHDPNQIVSQGGQTFRGLAPSRNGLAPRNQQPT